MAAPSWAPAPGDVAAILHSRTKEAGSGASTVEWTANTTPNITQVQSMIERACDEIQATVGILPVADETNVKVSVALSAGKSAATYLTAMILEASFRPNQVGEDDDLYAVLERRYDALLTALREALTNALPTDGDGAGADAASNFVEGGFPGLVGTTLTEEF